MPLKPVRRTTLPDAIVEQLLGALIDGGELRPGDKLPSERELAERLHVGRSAVREALRSLVALGIVRRNRDGAVISDIQREILAEPLRLALLVRQSNLRELFEARKVLEVELAGLAAGRATEENIAKMSDCLAQMREHAMSDTDRYVAADVAYHMSMADAAQNRVLYELFASVRELLVEAQAEAVKAEGITERSCDFHARILEAIRARDVEAARTTMLNHLNDVESALREVGSAAMGARSQ